MSLLDQNPCDATTSNLACFPANSLPCLSAVTGTKLSQRRNHRKAPKYPDIYLLAMLPCLVWLTIDTFYITIQWCAHAAVLVYDNDVRSARLETVIRALSTINDCTAECWLIASGYVMDWWIWLSIRLVAVETTLKSNSHGPASVVQFSHNDVRWAWLRVHCIQYIDVNDKDQEAWRTSSPRLLYRNSQ